MLASCVYLAINQLAALTFLFIAMPSVYGFDRPTEMLLAASRRKVSPELLYLFKQRVRRAEPDCSNEAESNLKLQQEIATMIIGNEDRSYISQSHSAPHKHRSKLPHEKPEMCEEDDGQDEITPDSALKERALCSFVYIENFNKTRLPQTIPEVQCACAKPTNRLILSRFPNIRCTAIYYNVPVIRFENGCQNFVKTTERLPLACIPIMAAQSTSNVGFEISEGEQAEVPI